MKFRKVAVILLIICMMMPMISNNLFVHATSIPADYDIRWRFEGNMDDYRGIVGLKDDYSAGNLQYNSTTHKEGTHGAYFDGNTYLYSWNSNNEMDGSYQLRESGATNQLTISTLVEIHEDRNQPIWRFNNDYLHLNYDSATRKFKTGLWQAYYTQLNSTETININEWYLVTYVVDGTSMKLYVNGTLSNSTTLSSGFDSSIYPAERWYMGVNVGGDQLFKGHLDDMIVYGRALTSAEIQSMYDLYFNTPPTISINNGLTLNEGETALITTDFHLSATDVDDDDTILTYTITSALSNGQLENTDNPGISINSFTHQQLMDYKIRYVHDGSNTISDSFMFKVADDTPSELIGQTFSITINAINDDPSITGLPADITVIEDTESNVDLSSVTLEDEDAGSGSITLNLSAASGMFSASSGGGVTVYGSGTGTLTLIGTVPNINTYLNTTSNIQYTGPTNVFGNYASTIVLAANDGGNTGSGGGSDVSLGTVNIHITEVNDAPRMVTNTGLTLNEGATKLMTIGELSSTDVDTDDATLTYTITTGPTNGQLENIDNPGVSISSFTQQLLIDGKIQYIHDGSNTTNDSFIFKVSDGTSNELIGQTFSIVVNAIDDGTPTITTNTGLTLNEGASKAITIGELSSTDVDTDDTTLTYTITTGPTNGQLENIDNPGVSISSFTQQLLVDGKIQYLHDGSNTTNDSFIFKVSDGAPNELTGQTFSITVNSMYIVNFKDFDGTVLKIERVEKNISSTAPINPSREGYTFTGWDKDFSNVTSDLIVTAQYSINQYIVSFNSNEGSVVTSQTLEYNSLVTEPTAPTKEGYNFGGWYKETELITSWKFASDRVPTEDVTLYGKWNLNTDTSYKIEHYQQDITASGYTLAETENLIGTTDTVVTAVAKSYTGFSENTSHASRIASGNILGDGSLVLKLYYDRNTYTVTFNDWDGTELKTQTVRYEETVTAPANPTKEDYTFIGWDVDFSNITSDLIVTAQFRINSYTVSFVSNGGTTVNSVTANYNTLLSEPTSPTKEDYDFGGWYKEAELINKWDFNSDVILAEDITLYAKWVPSQNSITMIASPISVEASDSFNQLFTLNISNDTVVGHVYKSDLSLGGVFSSLTIGEINNSNITVTAQVYGNLSSEGIGTITLNENKLENRTSPLSSDITVTSRPTYTISYNGNGTTSGTVPIDSSNYEMGDTVIIKGNTGNLVKTGYEFSGWNTKADGTGSTYTSGDTFSMGSSNVSLYAEWISREYTITFKDYDGTELITETVEHGNQATAPASPTREGYIFRGWYKDQFLTIAFDFNTSITEDITLYAKWTRINTDNDNDNDDGDEPEENQENNKNQQQGTIIINGKEERAGKESVTEEEGKKVVEVNVDAEAIIKKIEEVINNQTRENTQNVVEISIGTQDASKITIRLTGDIIREMEEDEFNLSIKSSDINYVIPAKEVGIESVAEKLSISKDKLQEIEIEVKIDKVDEKLAKIIEENAKANDYEVVFPPVNFNVVAKVKTSSGEEKEVSVSKFEQYVQRVMQIPEGVDPRKITTGILYNEDGTFSHIPTTVYMENDIWYAKLNSLTNSSYSVIWNPIKVLSVENHWSKKAVNNMAARLIVKNPDSFKPDENITRGEFAEYITKALGLYRTGISKTEKFRDVEITDQLADAIEIATEYGIINGYPDGTFRPKAEISREEAMVMYARAMDIAGLKEIDNSKIGNYKDIKEISDWAYNDVKKTVSVGVFNGKTNETINPKDTFTYAEAATAIRNLLIASGLINE